MLTLSGHVQCWSEWRESAWESRTQRIALGLFTSCALRKAMNQWVAWTLHKQQATAKAQMAVQVRPSASSSLIHNHAFKAVGRPSVSRHQSDISVTAGDAIDLCQRIYASLARQIAACAAACLS